MSRIDNENTRTTAAHRVQRFGLYSAAVSFMLVIAAIVLPVQSNGTIYRADSEESVPVVRAADVELKSTFKKVAGSRLIRPSQVQPAVKDSGAAQQLVKRLKLQSVVQMDGENIAYIRVQDGGVQTVRAGGHLLEFAVEEVMPGFVRLSLDGVVLDLTY